jgi:hypothetical protein
VEEPLTHEKLSVTVYQCRHPQVGGSCIIRVPVEACPQGAAMIIQTAQRRNLTICRRCRRREE